MAYPLHSCAPFAVLMPVASLDAPIDHQVADSPPLVETIKDVSPDVEAVVFANESVCAVAQFMSSLTPRQRDVVRRVFWDEQSQASVARDLQVSRAAVNKMISGVLKLGRAMLAEFRPELPAH